MTLSRLKQFMPITDAYELKPGRTYLLRVPLTALTQEMAPAVQKMNAVLQDEGIRIVLVTDDIPVVEQ